MGFLKIPNRFMRTFFKLNDKFNLKDKDKLDLRHYGLVLALLERKSSRYSPSNTTLAEDLGYADPSNSGANNVRKLIRKMESLHLIKVVRSKKENGVNNYNIYNLSPLFDEIQTIDSKIIDEIKKDNGKILQEYLYDESLFEDVEPQPEPKDSLVN